MILRVVVNALAGGGEISRGRGSGKRKLWRASGLPEATRSGGGERCRASAPSSRPGSFRQVISLTFGKFDLEPDTYCRYDSVSVFNGAASDDAKRLGKFCGDTAPG